MKKNGKIYPENSFQLVYTYSGNQKLTDDFYQNIYSFEKYLHKLYQSIKEQKLSEENLVEYFENNQLNIESKIGITEMSDFDKLINKVKIFENDSIQLKKAIFNIEEKIVNEEYTICPLTFQYSNGRELIFDLYISNSSDIEPLLQFIPR